MDNRKGLGKGLRALIPSNEGEAVSGPARQIPIEKIHPNPYQPRKFFDLEKIAELADSVRRHGILQPLVVREKGGDFELIAGERRFEAAKRAGLSEVPALIRACTDAESLELAIVENVQREDISPLEAAIAYRRLADEFSLSQEEIAHRVGKSRPAIANTLRLLNLPAPVQQSLSEGEITEGHARALLGLNDPEALLSVWESAVKTGASVRETERMVREIMAPREQEPVEKAPESPAPRVKDPNLLQIEADLRRMLGTRVEIRQGTSKGSITIEFYSDEDLERILGLLAE